MITGRAENDPWRRRCLVDTVLEVKGFRKREEEGVEGFSVFKNAEDDVDEFAHDGDMWTNVKTPNA